MDGQITLTEAMSSVTYDRYGKPYQTPDWMDKDRCELCRHWTRLPEEDQPPAGWGVKGQCDVSEKRLGYVQVMDGWCRHWAKDKEESEVSE